MEKLASSLIVVILVFSLVPFTLAQSNVSTSLIVRPHENVFYTNTTSVGETFTVSVVAEDIPADNGMYGWEFILTWTPGLVNCTAEEINFNIWPYFLGPWVSDPIDNANGQYHQSLTARSPSNPVSGTYWLVNLTFTVIAEPSNSVNFTLQPAPGFTYCLLNSAAIAVP